MGIKTLTHAKGDTISARDNACADCDNLGGAVFLTRHEDFHSHVCTEGYAFLCLNQVLSVLYEGEC